ncbi:MAG: pirin family protein [Desulfobulbaceae bacterium]|nr:pirin family protein [Desulfobulbaceae bacterium]
MLEVKNGNKRGKTNIEWLKSYHSFSFGEYFDNSNIRFGSLRVLNDDTVLGGGGFPTHPHKDMEIITYVTEGALKHKDSMGTEEIIHSGEVQKMSAGTGVYHSEFNNSETQNVHFYQVWIFPEEKGLPPSYEKVKPEKSGRKNRLQLIASPEKVEGTVLVRQDAKMFLSDLDEGTKIKYELNVGRGSLVHLISGKILVNELELYPGDEVRIFELNSFEFLALDNSEFLMFDVSLSF